MLKEYRRRRSSFLSGGEQQMVAIGRMLMSDPEVLLLDEPSDALSPVAVDSVVKALLELRRRGASLLLVEQRVDVAIRICDRLHIMTHGEIVDEMTPETVRAGGPRHHQQISRLTAREGRMALDHSLRPDQLLLDPGRRRGAPAAARITTASPANSPIRLDERTIRYVLETRPHFEELRQAIGQVAGMLVLAAAGAKTVTQDHPLFTTAREALAQRLRRDPGRAAHGAGNAIITGICWTPWRRCASPCGGRRRICICTAWSASASSRCWRPLNAAYRHLSWAAKALPGFEVLSFDQACCAPQQPVTPHTQAGRKAS